MPATYIHFSDEQRVIKEKTGLSWEDIVNLGLKAAQNTVGRVIEPFKSSDRGLGVLDDTPQQQPGVNTPIQ